MVNKQKLVATATVSRNKRLKKAIKFIDKSMKQRAKEGFKVIQIPLDNIPYMTGAQLNEIIKLYRQAGYQIEYSKHWGDDLYIDWIEDEYIDWSEDKCIETK